MAHTSIRATDETPARAHREEAADRGERTASGMPVTQHRLLVVDDEAAMRKLLSVNLKASGYDVRTAADGMEALHVLEQDTFDLLLLDVSMPGPSGLQVLETVRRSSHMPILIVSGRGCETGKVAARSRGADDYLVKPFGMAEPLARVQALLRRSSSGAAGLLLPSGQPSLEVDLRLEAPRPQAEQG